MARIRNAQAAIRRRHGEPSVPPVHSKHGPRRLSLSNSQGGGRAQRGLSRQPPTPTSSTRLHHNLRLDAATDASALLLSPGQESRAQQALRQRYRCIGGVRERTA
jgi:hypothetical protein